MLLIGHRGCHYPGFNQSTIRAFAKVAGEGVPAIEFDVQRCGDGQLVVVHNLDLEEVSNGKGRVSETDSGTLRRLYAGDPARGKDRIPFLSEVFDFFASLPSEQRPVMHLELKGEGTGRSTGALFGRYRASGALAYADILVSSFNWQELEAIRETCPALDIALLEGSIRRGPLLEKSGIEAEGYFKRIFAFGAEQYMLPRSPRLSENLSLLEEICPDPVIRKILADEIAACLAGDYYTDALLDQACAMRAAAVNLWYRSLTSAFVERANARGLAVFAYTVNTTNELWMLAEMGVDGVFTDDYAGAARVLGVKIRSDLGGDSINEV